MAILFYGYPTKFNFLPFQIQNVMKIKIILQICLNRKTKQKGFNAENFSLKRTSVDNRSIARTIFIVLWDISQVDKKRNGKTVSREFLKRQ